MDTVDNFLDKITMYKLTLYYLMAIVGAAIFLSFIGVLSYNPTDILFETIIVILVCYIANHVFAWIFNTNTNSESVFITAFILVLIIPVKFPDNSVFFVLASMLAMGIKYLPVIEKRHIFNPAAGSVAAFSLLSPEHTATWWVGTPALFPVVFIGGLLLARKIQRENLVFTFLVIVSIFTCAAPFLHGGDFFSALNLLNQSVFRSALFFFAFVMLTEPLTSPTTKKLRGWYGGLVAVLYTTPQIRLLGLILTPEMALCIGNVFSYFISPWSRFSLKLVEKIQVSFDTIDFVFFPEKKLAFIPGQYMEWMLPHKEIDERGSRRYFTIASSPTENNIILGVKFYKNGSSYKRAMNFLSQGENITASQIAGDFILPKNKNQKLVFIAGGIGITPYRSILKYLLDMNERRDIVLLYSNKLANEIMYAADIFDSVQRNLGVKIIYTLTDVDSIPQDWKGKTGRINARMIADEVPDYNERLFYLSGSHEMVARFEQVLKDMKIPSSQIKIDFFPGYA